MSVLASRLCLVRTGLGPPVAGRAGARIDVHAAAPRRRHGAPYPATTLARLSQGKMMDVNYNKDKTWVGSSGNLWPA